MVSITRGKNPPIFGDPKRYLYFWGIWSPFTVRIFYSIMRNEL